MLKVTVKKDKLRIDDGRSELEEIQQQSIKKRQFMTIQYINSMSEI